MLFRKVIRSNYKLILTTLAILLIGLVSLYSASYQGSSKFSQSLLWKQLVWILLGLILSVGAANFPYRKLSDFAFPLYGVSLLFLVLVLFLGPSRLGAQRWLKLGSLTFQPSELMKLAYILTLAGYLTRNPSLRSSSLAQNKPIKLWHNLGIPLLLTLIPLILILKEPDLGSSSVLLPIALCMLYVSGTKGKHLIILIVVGLLCSPLIWRFLENYQKERLLVFINPNLDPLGAGYTVIQSRIAIGSGRLFGKGLLAGTQNLLNFLPERHSDFIFSVVAEEWGFCGTTLLLFLYYSLISQGIKTAAQTNDLLGRLLATGIVAMFSFQIVVNIGMSMGMLPVVGLPLPLVSYGGSSMLICLLSLGLLINVSIRRPKF